jgi:hypothetical protein
MLAPGPRSGLKYSRERAAGAPSFMKRRIGSSRRLHRAGTRRRSNCSARRRLQDAESASAESGGLGFVPAVVDADPPAVASGSKAQTIVAPVEVEIGDVKIRIGRGADAATLAMVLRALKAGA